MALYNAAGGTNWTDNTIWLTDTPVGSWYGVTTGFAGCLNELILEDNGLTGPIPPELSNLTYLNWLSLRINEISREIPPELGNLANLEALLLDRNRLTGQILPSLGNLTNLD